MPLGPLGGFDCRRVIEASRDTIGNAGTDICVRQVRISCDHPECPSSPRVHPASTGGIWLAVLGEGS